MKHKKIMLTIFVAIVLTAGSVFIGLRALKKQEDISTEDWKIYRSEIDGYEISYPADWITIENFSIYGKSVLIKTRDYTESFQDFEGGSVPIIKQGAEVVITKHNSGTFKNIEELRQSFELGRGGYGIVVEKEIIVGNKRALYHILNDPIEGNMENVHFIINSKTGACFNITFYYNNKNSGHAYEKIFKSMLNTFKLLN